MGLPASIFHPSVRSRGHGGGHRSTICTQALKIQIQVLKLTGQAYSPPTLHLFFFKTGILTKLAPELARLTVL